MRFNELEDFCKIPILSKLPDYLSKTLPLNSMLEAIGTQIFTQGDLGEFYLD